MKGKKPIKLCLAGATGKMGKSVLTACNHWKDIQIVALVASPKSEGLQYQHLIISSRLKKELQSEVDVFLDFTEPEIAFSHVKLALQKQVPCVVGTTGWTQVQIQKIRRLSEEKKTPVFYIPNFSIASSLALRFAQQASSWIQDCTIIESHHPQKKDKPSGTALQTAQWIPQEVPIHSIRLSGILAQQSTLFGALGETLEIRHQVIDRIAYMEGVHWCLTHIQGQQGFHQGLHTLLEKLKK